MTDTEDLIYAKMHDLEELQRNSAAVETLFTITLLGFAWAQVEANPLAKFSIPDVAFILTIILALVIGGQNLVSILYRETGLHSFWVSWNTEVTELKEIDVPDSDHEEE